MNCLDYRRALLAEPNCQNKVVIAHSRHCQACARFARDLHQQEQVLLQTLRVPTPPTLANNIQLAQSLQRRRSNTLVAMAASALLTLGISSWLASQWLTPSPHQQLAQTIATHWQHHPAHLQTTAETRHNAEVDRVLATLGAERTAQLPQVLQATLCPMDGKLGAHLVLKDSRGVYTVFLLPEHDVSDTVTLPLADPQTNGTLQPAGKGAIAIVADTSLSLSDLRHTVLSQLRWRG